MAILNNQRVLSPCLLIKSKPFLFLDIPKDVLKGLLQNHKIQTISPFLVDYSIGISDMARCICLSNCRSPVCAMFVPQTGLSENLGTATSTCELFPTQIARNWGLIPLSDTHRWAWVKILAPWWTLKKTDEPHPLRQKTRVGSQLSFAFCFRNSVSIPSQHI